MGQWNDAAVEAEAEAQGLREMKDQSTIEKLEKRVSYLEGRVADLLNGIPPE